MLQTSEMRQSFSVFPVAEMEIGEAELMALDKRELVAVLQSLRQALEDHRGPLECHLSEIDLKGTSVFSLEEPVKDEEDCSPKCEKERAVLGLLLTDAIEKGRSDLLEKVEHALHCEDPLVPFVERETKL